MSKLKSTRLIPEYKDNLAFFLGDLRSWTYSSQSKVAQILGLSHSTISRYENGHLRPPVGYLAHLTSCLFDQINPDDRNIQQQTDRILTQINQAIRWCYPDETPFRNWDELLVIANGYLESRQLDEEISAQMDDRFRWRVTPEIENFCGRSKELKNLEALVNAPNTNIVLILGMGGIGKTALAAKLSENLENKFEYVIWNSLYNSPSLNDLCNAIPGFLPSPVLTDPTQSPEQQIIKLMNFFRNHHCLLIFDNLESVMEGGDQIGKFRPGFEEYSTFLQAFAAQPKQSCLVLTSREMPAILNEWTKSAKSVHAFYLKGFQTMEAQQLLQPWDFKADRNLVGDLNRNLSGNPLALIMAAEVIDTFYGKDVATFLQIENPIVGDIRQFLNKTFDRCSQLSRVILYWLSVLRENVSLQRIEELLIPRPPRSDIVEGLHSLIRSSLVESRNGEFSLQTFVGEYLNDRFIREVYNSILENEVANLKTVALITTDSSIQVQQAQHQNLIQPIIDLLLKSLAPQQITDRLTALIDKTRGPDFSSPGYSAGNLINLMLQLHPDLTNQCFSNPTIRHADFRNCTLHETDFSYSRLLNCIFDIAFSGINAVALSPSAKYLAVAVEEDIRIWDLEERQPYLLLKGHSEIIWNLSFVSVDHILYSQGADTFVHRWKLSNGEIELSIRDQVSPISAISVNPEATFLASGNKAGDISLWNARNGQKLLALHTSSGTICSLTVDSSGKQLLAGYLDGKVTLWRISTGETFTLVDVHDGPVTAVTFIGSGNKFATGGKDGKISVRDTSNGELIQELSGHTKEITVLKCCLKKNTLVSGSLDGTVSTWDLNTGERKQIFEGNKRSVRSLDLNLEGNLLVTGSYDQTIRLWDMSSGQLLDSIEGLTFDIRALAFNPEGKTIASGGTDSQVRLWNLPDKQGKKIEKGHGHWVSAVAFSPDGTKLASGGYDRTVRIWDVYSGKELISFSDFPQLINCLDIHPDGNIIAAGGNEGEIQLWTLTNNRERFLLNGHSTAINCLKFSEDGEYLVSGGEDQVVCVWQRKTRCMQKKIESVGSPVLKVGCDLKSSVLHVLTEDCRVKTYDFDSGELVQVDNMDTGNLKTAAFTLQNDFLAYCTHQDDQSITLWDIENKSGVFKKGISNCAITSLAFNSQGTLLAVGNIRGEIIILDLTAQVTNATMMVRMPYDGMNITGISGLGFEQIETLKALGAVEKYS